MSISRSGERLAENLRLMGDTASSYRAMWRWQWLRLAGVN